MSSGIVDLYSGSALLSARQTTPNSWFELDEKKSSEIKPVCDEFGLDLMEQQILVNIDTQKLHLIASQQLTNSYPVSTAKNGVGQRENSGQTPLGLHFVESKIGDGANPFEVFKSRLPTGVIAQPNGKENYIVGRILWLQGAQPGFNQGKDLDGKVVDSHSRYIYIHGTNDIANIGACVSGGCIRMIPDDVVELFGKVSEKTPVYIYKA